MTIKYDPKVYMQYEKDYKMKPEYVKRKLYKMDRYFKRYLHILNLTTNQRLKDDIYKIIIDKLTMDNMLYDEGKRISTLAKWLPREKSSFDKKLNFVETITKKMYPHLKRSIAYKTYRQLIVKLCKPLNLTESLITTKDYDNIDFKKVPEESLRVHMKTFLRNDSLRQRLDTFLLNKYNKLTVKKFITLLNVKETHPKEKEMMVKSFSLRKQKLLKEYPYLYFSQGRYIMPVIDLSKDAFDKNNAYMYIMVLLVVLESTNKFIVNSKSPQLEEINPKSSIFNKVNTIMSKVDNNDIINLTELSKLKDIERFFIISEQDVIGEIPKNKKHKYKDRHNNIYYWKKKRNIKKQYSLLNVKKQYIFLVVFIVFVGIYSLVRFSQPTV